MNNSGDGKGNATGGGWIESWWGVEWIWGIGAGIASGSKDRIGEGTASGYEWRFIQGEEGTHGHGWASGWGWGEVDGEGSGQGRANGNSVKVPLWEEVGGRWERYYMSIMDASANSVIDSNEGDGSGTDEE